MTPRFILNAMSSRTARSADPGPTVQTAQHITSLALMRPAMEHDS